MFRMLIGVPTLIVSPCGDREFPVGYIQMVLTGLDGPAVTDADYDLYFSVLRDLDFRSRRLRALCTYIMENASPEVLPVPDEVKRDTGCFYGLELFFSRNGYRTCLPHELPQGCQASEVWEVAYVELTCSINTVYRPAPVNFSGAATV